MSSESPLTLRQSLSSRTGIAVVVLVVLFTLYAVLIQAQVLVVVYLLSVAFLLWLLSRFVRAHERIAVAQERRAAVATDDSAGDVDRSGTAGDATADTAPADADGVDRPASGVAEPGDQPDGEDDREE
ncbi:hypothetical protein [Halobaculum gomorrense]|uniref:DUF4229 domain-containing protein n=1 Tax=Halobaculum gomorrense TaxID=43928 RepID=A0A1M5MBN2_9EURY|nr:hypothetical protein [Halobaculum gomorrense]SHG74133.1 hypothetical protein SAMN05443636_0939 [Halobaculum gomorrense]